jgi:CTP:molybdopterin cytidylyltransferase MocA
MCALKVGAVILAAGASTRFGRPKQNVLLGGETLVGRSIRVAAEALLAPIIVVVREGAEFADSVFSAGAVVAINREADEGIASSIRSGVLAAMRYDVTGLILMTSDQPGVDANHLRRLREDEQRLTGSGYGHVVGVPAYFPASLFTSLLQLRGDIGAREFLRSAYPITNEDLRLDIDTERDLEEARKFIAKKSVQK